MRIVLALILSSVLSVFASDPEKPGYDTLPPARDSLESAEGIIESTNAIADAIVNHLRIEIPEEVIANETIATSPEAEQEFVTGLADNVDGFMEFIASPGSSDNQEAFFLNPIILGYIESIISDESLVIPVVVDDNNTTVPPPESSSTSAPSPVHVNDGDSTTGSWSDID